MGSKIYVGNLSFDANEESLQGLFSQYGTVKSVKIITDKITGKSRGFGFVEMSSNEEAQTAISNLDGKELQSRAMRVSEAQEKTEGGGGGRGGPRGGGRPFGGNRDGGRDRKRNF